MIFLSDVVHEYIRSTAFFLRKQYVSRLMNAKYSSKRREWLQSRTKVVYYTELKFRSLSTNTVKWRPDIDITRRFNFSGMCGNHQMDVFKMPAKKLQGRDLTVTYMKPFRLREYEEMSHMGKTKQNYKYINRMCVYSNSGNIKFNSCGYPASSSQLIQYQRVDGGINIGRDYIVYNWCRQFLSKRNGCVIPAHDICIALSLHHPNVRYSCGEVTIWFYFTCVVWFFWYVKSAILLILFLCLTSH